MLWEGALYDAKVDTVHATGAVDVLYDVSGTFGAFLTPEEHGLEAMPTAGKGKKKKQVCHVGGCSNMAHGGGLCTTHCRKVCSVEGCACKARASSLCANHGGGRKEREERKQCAKVGCLSESAAGRRFCNSHYVKPCAVKGCDTRTKARGLCGKHGANGQCLVDKCSGNARHRRGFCSRHGGRDGFCTTPGCETPCVQGTRVCAKHGANGTCAASGCTAHSMPRKKVCGKHWADKPACSAEGCSFMAVARGVCKTHDSVRPRVKRPCSIPGCSTFAVARGICVKHGARGYCSGANGRCNSAVYVRGL